MGTPDEILQRAGAAAGELRGQMQGRVLLPADPGYAKARQVWNGAVAHQPALIAQCAAPDDVRAAVLAARRHGLPLSVRGGGHDWAGRSLRQHGLVVDLSAMRQVQIDPAAQEATIEPGVTAHDLLGAAAEYGLAAVTGNCGGVGMVGLSLGGGYGQLSARHGLAADNILSAEVTLGDGRSLHASADENAELYWALRGGGGNFGVVTSMRIRLHPLRELLGGIILFPWHEARTVLQRYAAVMASAPDELGVAAGVLSAPDGSPVVLLAPTWVGAAAEGAAVIARLEQLGTPMLTQIGPMPYHKVLEQFDDHIIDGRHNLLKTRWLADLTPTVIGALIDAGNARTSPFSAIVLHHCHGVAAAVPAAATAFGMRRTHFLLEIIATWEPEPVDTGTAHHLWAERLWRRLAPHALPGGYANLLAPDEDEQIAQAYGANAARLRDAKRRFDPENSFSAIPLPL